MQFDKIIKGGTIVTSSDTIQADIGILSEKITAIDAALPEEGAELLTASGRYVFPGCIDVHTHLYDPSLKSSTSDEFEIGTIAAAWGGTTTIVDFAEQRRGEPLQKGLETWHRKAEGQAVIDYSFHLIITDLPESKVRDLDRVVEAGVTSFKLFMAYPDTFMVDDATIFRTLLHTKETGGMVSVHAETGGVIDVLVKRALTEGKTDPKYHALTRPMSTEAEATRHAIALAEIAGAPLYIVHLSAGDAMEAVREARERGLSIYAETCPQYLCLSDEEYERPDFEGAKYVMSPPLRTKGNEERLWGGLATNSLQVVSTDHGAICFGGPSGREAGRGDFSKIPNGVPGIEARLHLLYDSG